MSKNKSIVLSLIPAIIASAIFLMAWIEPDVDLKDPWYRALDKLNEGNKLRKENPEKAKQLLAESGERFAELVEKYPQHAKLRMLNGYYLMNAGKSEEAISELKIAIDKGKGGLVNQIEYQAGDMLTQVAIQKTNAMLTQAQKSGNQNQVNEANKYLSELIEYAPANANMQFQYGRTFAQLGNYNDALKYYNRAIRINPKHEQAGRGKATINFAIGNQLVSKNNFEQAYKHYKEAQKIIPNHPDYNNNLGNVCMRLNKFKEAAKHFKLAVQKVPKNKVYKGNLKVAKQALAQQKQNQNG